MNRTVAYAGMHLYADDNVTDEEAQQVAAACTSSGHWPEVLHVRRVDGDVIGYANTAVSTWRVFLPRKPLCCPSDSNRD